jgi:hypothetical protein
VLVHPCSRDIGRPYLFDVDGADPAASHTDDQQHDGLAAIADGSSPPQLVAPQPHHADRQLQPARVQFTDPAFNPDTCWR